MAGVGLWLFKNKQKIREIGIKNGVVERRYDAIKI